MLENNTLLKLAKEATSNTVLYFHLSALIHADIDMQLVYGCRWYVYTSNVVGQGVLITLRCQTEMVRIN